ncbi:MAG: DUF4116 domain-containing protein [Rhabdochlamydiaceae bacterium]|jgi:hypothetical protein
MEIIKSTALQFVPNSVRAPISALLDNLTTSRIKKIALLSISFLIVRKLIAARNHFLNFHRNIIPLMQRDGMALASLSKEMRDHPYVVLQAVRNNGLAFQFASDRLKKTSLLQQ